MAEGMNEENRDTDKWAGDKYQYLCNSQRKSRSHFGKNINMNVSFSKQTRQELNTCTAPYDKFLRANHSYKHDDNIYTSRSRHDHRMQRIQTFHQKYTHCYSNRWGHFATRSTTNLRPPHQDLLCNSYILSKSI